MSIATVRVPRCIYGAEVVKVTPIVCGISGVKEDADVIRAVTVDTTFEFRDQWWVAKE